MEYSETSIGSRALAREVGRHYDAGDYEFVPSHEDLAIAIENLRDNLYERPDTYSTETYRVRLEKDAEASDVVHAYFSLGRI